MCTFIGVVLVHNAQSNDSQSNDAWFVHKFMHNYASMLTLCRDNL